MAMPGTISSSVVPSGLSLMPTLDILSLPRDIPLLPQGEYYLSVSKAQFRCWMGELNASVSGTQRHYISMVHIQPLEPVCWLKS